MSKFIWLVLAVAVIAVAYFVFAPQGGPSYQAVQTPPAPPRVLPSSVSANPDVFVSDLVQSSAQEVLTPEEADPSLVAANDQAVNDLDQSSNPNQF